jgi:thioredoxin-like negative regulator of GroEL
MLALVFVQFAFCGSPAAIVDLTTENWEMHIEQRDPDTVWFITFLTDALPPCRELHGILQKAATEADGMVRFGVIQADREERLALRFQVRILPTMFILHKGGRVDYTEKRSERAIVSAAAKYIPDKSAIASPDWGTDGQESVILFTDRKKTPPIWAAISALYQGKIRVGLSTDRSLMSQFNVTKTPTILFVNKTVQIVYTGKTAFTSLSQAIDDFIKHEYEEPFQFNADFFLPEEYKDESQNFTGYCVIHTVSDLDPALKLLQTKLKSAKLKFFYGEEDLPFDFMKPDQIYIIAPHKQSGMRLNSVSELEPVLQRIFEGRGEWTALEAMGDS